MSAIFLSTTLLMSPIALSDDKADMEKLQKDITELQKELKKVESSRNNVQQELEKNQSHINDLQKKVDKIQQDINSQDTKLDNLKKERSNLEKARAKQQAQAAEQIRAAYQLGQQPEFKVFLNQESPERVSRMMKYNSYFMAAHAEKMKDYLNTITQLNDLEPQIAQKTTELNEIKQALDAERDRKSVV